MNIRDLAGKNIAILGFGREGRAMASALEKHAPGVEITIADANEKIEIDESKYWAQVGTGWLKNLEKFDVIIKSPGIPPLKELTTDHLPLTTSSQIFFDSIKDTGAIIIGVTGSKGKSTTSTLIYEILKKAGKDTYLVGNIGEPAISYIEKAKKGTIFVHELSSYQLMDLSVSPQIAVVTAFFPEHLDYHGSLEKYLEAKTHIAKFQRPEDVVFYCTTSAGSKTIAAEGKGKKIPFSEADAPVKLDQIKLKGTHNLSNIAAAHAVARHLEIDEQTTINVIKEFKGLPHRLQSLGVIDGIEWVNDSISTTPESAIAALDALGDSVATIILGGQDRGYDFTPLVERLKRPKIETVILLPDSGKTIGDLLKKADANIKAAAAESMQEAVRIAKRETKNSPLEALRPSGPNGKLKTPIVLLSPASPSYGHFKNFEDRGEQFAQAIQK